MRLGDLARGGPSRDTPTSSKKAGLRWFVGLADAKPIENHAKTRPFCDSGGFSTVFSTGVENFGERPNAHATIQPTGGVNREAADCSTGLRKIFKQHGFGHFQRAAID